MTTGNYYMRVIPSQREAHGVEILPNRHGDQRLARVYAEMFRRRLAVSPVRPQAITEAHETLFPSFIVGLPVVVVNVRIQRSTTRRQSSAG